MREERHGTSLGFLVKLVLLIGLILIGISVFVHVLHLLFLVAIIWFIGFLGLMAYRLGQRRGP